MSMSLVRLSCSWESSESRIGWPGCSLNMSLMSMLVQVCITKSRLLAHRDWGRDHHNLGIFCYGLFTLVWCMSLKWHLFWKNPQQALSYFLEDLKVNLHSVNWPYWELDDNVLRWSAAQSPAEALAEPELLTPWTLSTSAQSWDQLLADVPSWLNLFKQEYAQVGVLMQIEHFLYRREAVCITCCTRDPYWSIEL